MTGAALKANGGVGVIDPHEKLPEGDKNLGEKNPQAILRSASAPCCHREVSACAWATSAGKSTSPHSCPSMETVLTLKLSAMRPMTRRYHDFTPSAVRMTASTVSAKQFAPQPLNTRKPMDSAFT